MNSNIKNKKTRRSKKNTENEKQLKKARRDATIEKNEENIIKKSKKNEKTFRERIQIPNNRRTKEENIMARKNSEFQDGMRKSAYLKAIERIKSQEER